MNRIWCQTKRIGRKLGRKMDDIIDCVRGKHTIDTSVTLSDACLRVKNALKEEGEYKRVINVNELVINE